MVRTPESPSSLLLRASLRDILEQTSSSKTAATSSPSSPVPTMAPRSSSMATSSSSTNDEDSLPIISISDSYDSGNGEVTSIRLVDGEEDQCDVHVAVRIKPDPYTLLENKQHFQYFSFRAALNAHSPTMRGLFSGKKSIKVKYIVENAGEASYASAFEGYRTFVTEGVTPFDPDAWARVEDTRYEGGRLTWNHVHKLDGKEGGGALSAYFAYFPPYSWERHLGLMAKCAEAKGATVASLGQTIEGRELDYVTVGTGGNTCWIIHRQHPGESMAEFYAEGLLNRLLGLDGKWDKVAEKARELYTFNIVPNINPDGSTNGHLRTNAAGQNLNREWCPSLAPHLTDGDDAYDANAGTMYDAPTLERSPEVYHLLRRMDETGCDAFLDIHGDEELPFNFLAGSQGMSVWSKRLEALHGAFLASYERANGDMQAKVSYEPDGPGEGMPNICSNQIGERFDCFAGTLEMPFKECWVDTMNAGKEDGDKRIGWGPERARQLGASVLDALCYISPHLRDEGEFWSQLPEKDAYVNPSSKY